MSDQPTYTEESECWFILTTPNERDIGRVVRGKLAYPLEPGNNHGLACFENGLQWSGIRYDQIFPSKETAYAHYARSLHARIKDLQEELAKQPVVIFDYQPTPSPIP